MEIKLLERVSQDLQTSKDFFIQRTGNTIDTITAVSNQNKDSLTKTSEQAKEIVMQTSGKIFQSLNEETSQAVITVTQATEKAKNSLTHATSHAVTNISESSKSAVGSIAQTAQKAKEAISQTSVQAVDSIHQVSEQTKASLEQTIQKTEGLSHSLTEGIEKGINSYVTDWINHHVILGWFLTHPLYSIVIFIVLIVLVWGLFQAIGGLIVKSWIAVLLSPAMLVRSLLLKNSQSTTNTINDKLLSPKIDSEDPQERCNTILHRLNEIKQEQDSLLQELAKILETTDLNLKLK
jgi:Fe2+ transport system protein B